VSEEICFYHNDMDGKCAGAIVNHAYPGMDLRPVQYGQTIPLDDVHGKDVYMVDFCLQPFDLMEELASTCYLTWIDHHKSAIEESVRRGFKCHDMRIRIGSAGCELAWEHFFGNIEMPRAVHLLGRYDVWDHSDPDILPFQYAMRTYGMLPESHAWWECLFSMSDLSQYIEYGQTIILYIDSYYADYAQSAFDTELDGVPAIALNLIRSSSQAFDTVYDPDKHSMMISFGWRHGQWTVSLYATKEGVDVSEIAKRYGGGGHKGAAGFQCSVLPFELA